MAEADAWLALDLLQVARQWRHQPSILQALWRLPSPKYEPFVGSLLWNMIGPKWFLLSVKNPGHSPCDRQMK